MRRSFVVPLVALALSCGEDCNDVPCSTTLIVELSADTWEDGDYEVAIGAEANSTTCTFTLSGGMREAAACSLDVAHVDTSELAAGYVLIRYSTGEPAALTVSLTRGGTELARGELAPEYEEFDTGNCGGPCRAAQVSLAVP